MTLILMPFKGVGTTRLNSVMLRIFLHHQPEVQHVCAKAKKKWLNIMLHFLLKMYCCEWSVIKPNETSRESIHISVSRYSLLIYSMFLFEKLVVDTFGSHLYSYKNKDLILVILHIFGFE